MRLTEPSPDALAAALQERQAARVECALGDFGSIARGKSVAVAEFATTLEQVSWQRRLLWLGGGGAQAQTEVCAGGAAHRVPIFLSLGTRLPVARRSVVRPRSVAVRR